MRNAPDPAPDVAVTVLQQLVAVADAARAAVSGPLAELGLTESAAGLLWALEPGTPPMAMRDLARRLGCDPSTISLLGDRLERAGLVERRPHPDDGRVRILALTERGRQVWDRVRRQAIAVSPLATLTPAEQHQLSALLARALGAGDG